ncbi:MAG TPA: DUF4058 family protein [Pirellulales bacterium]|nr:DUF4058 family protein [Pirellulales bacterium]
MPVHDWTKVPAGVFHEFHQHWTVRLELALNGGILPPDYYAMIEQASSGHFPDVLTFQVGQTASGAHGHGPPAAPSNGGVLTLAQAPPRVSYTATIESDAYADKTNRVVVFDDADEVVAVLEVVSPGNKSIRYAFEKFAEKALRFLRNGIHLMVIDLFPPTSRDPRGMHAAIWSEMIDYDFHLPPERPLTVASYSAGGLKRAFVEAIGVGTPLPAMPLFLHEDRYVQAPLEATYQTAFDEIPRRWRDVLAARAAGK